MVKYKAFFEEVESIIAHLECWNIDTSDDAIKLIKKEIKKVKRC
jgi:hypothetical protein